MERIELRLTDELYQELAAYKPKSMSLPGFCKWLIEQSLDSTDTLGVQGAAGTPSISTSTVSNTITSNIYKAENCEETPTNEPEEPEPKSKSKRAKTIGTPEFEAFWRQYQAIKKRASNQSKPKALELFTKVVKQHGAERLMAALSRAVTQQARIEREGGFASPFPDCFRWLRDGYYEAYLEEPAAAVAAAAVPALVQPPAEFADCPF